MEEVGRGLEDMVVGLMGVFGWTFASVYLLRFGSREDARDGKGKGRIYIGWILLGIDIKD